MPKISNFKNLATTPQRETVLKIIESGLESIQPRKVLETNFILNGSKLKILNEEFDLKKFERIFLIGFGKGSAGISKLIEKKLGDYLTEGYVIDNVPCKFSKINFTLGTHPLPSEENFKFTQKVIEKFSNLNDRDLVLIVICGGGSAMLVHPHGVTLEKKIEVEKALLKSGATISEMNAVRKHLSDVKGGGLAQILWPATVATLIYSDVPGNDLSVIASGPTVHDPTKVEDSLRIVAKYGLEEELNLSKDAFVENPQDQKYFENVHNIIVISNKTALNTMKNKAKSLGFETDLYSDRLQGDAKLIGEKLVQAAKPGRILLAGGETTLKVLGKGKGGRNQTLVLATLPYLSNGTVIASFDTDGIDFYHFAGAMGDETTNEKSQKLKLDQKKYLSDDNSYEFFEKTGDGIFTGKLESNVSDLMIVLKAKNV